MKFNRKAHMTDKAVRKEGGGMSYVVVTFGAEAPGWCTLSHCPIEAFGPFKSQAKAARFQETLPKWQQPHILRVVSTLEAP